MSNIVSPAPPWRVVLKGEKKDLEDLAVEHSRGTSKVLCEEGPVFP